MKTRAAVAFEANRPLEAVELDLDGPKQGEVLVEIMATGLCHTDAYTLAGLDSEGRFPSVLGHEGTGIVCETGAGVTTSASATTLFRSTRRNAASASRASAAGPTCAPRSARRRVGD